MCRYVRERDPTTGIPQTMAIEFMMQMTLITSHHMIHQSLNKNLFIFPIVLHNRLTSLKVDVLIAGHAIHAGNGRG